MNSICILSKIRIMNFEYFIWIINSFPLELTRVRFITCRILNIIIWQIRKDKEKLIFWNLRSQRNSSSAITFKGRINNLNCLFEFLIEPTFACEIISFFSSFLLYFYKNVEHESPWTNGISFVISLNSLQ